LGARILIVFAPGGIRVCHRWASVRNQDGAFATLEIMFMHRITITGCRNRGAWPWRTPLTLA